MSTPDSNNIGIKLQAAGENLSTWGDPNLNNDLIVLSNLASKFNPITINGDYSIASNSSTYSTSNPDEVALIRLIAGTVVANFNFTLAGRPKRIAIWNGTGFAAQIKLAATTGFSLPAGAIAMVATDGTTDVYNVSPTIFATGLTVAGKIQGVSTPVATTDAANKTYVDTAIALAALPATAGTVRNSGGDTTAGYASQKVTASGLLQATTKNPGGNETLDLAATTYTASGTDTYTITPSPVITAYVVGLRFSVLFTNANTTVATLNVSGLGAKSITKNGSTALGRADIPAGAVRMLSYDGSQFQLESTPTDISSASEAFTMSSNFGPWGN